MLITLQETLHLTKDELAIYPLPEPPYVIMAHEFIYYQTDDRLIKDIRKSDEIPRNVHRFLKGQHDKILLQKLENYL